MYRVVSVLKEPINIQIFYTKELKKREKKEKWV